MPQDKELLTDRLLVAFNKKDMDWIKREASHRRLTPTHLVRMAVFDWFRRNSETKGPQTKKK